MSELRDPANRRFGYPFTTCSECGPRFSIAAGVRFDRALTSMHDFAMCADCHREYRSPEDRRFHAQTISCSSCGPRLTGHAGDGTETSDQAAILAAADSIAAGAIVLLKGVGGFQWVCDGTNGAAVARLRQIKRRPEKPFALMVPGLTMARTICDLGPAEEHSLASAAAPIVLAARRSDPGPAITIAPNVNGMSHLHGIMLPASPLHALLVEACGCPLVVTSANRCNEPMIIDDAEAAALLGRDADLLLTHNRRITHRVDDSIVRIINGSETPLRIGRGLAPVYLEAAPEPASTQTLLALGGQLKTAFALSTPAFVVLSQHIGDLDTLQTSDYLREEIESYEAAINQRADCVITDAHPDALSHIDREDATQRVPHHQAHVLSCAWVHGFRGQALGVAWDGMGWGEDSVIHGGEFFALDTESKSLTRIASLLPFALPGGDRAAREPRRCAIAVAWELFGESWRDELSARDLSDCFASFSRRELAWLQQQLRSGGRLETTSVGRLYDAICAFVGGRQICSFEGQGAMLVEGLATQPEVRACESSQVEFVERDGIWFIDWRQPMRRWLDDLAAGATGSDIAAALHRFLASAIRAVAARTGHRTLILSGGVFQNRVLTELVTAQAREHDLEILCHRRVPPNDGGLAVGQLAQQLYGIGS